jgi:hypothetical protein
MFIRAIIWGFIFYFGYLVYQSFKELTGKGDKKIKTPKSKPNKSGKTFNKENIEEIDYEEIDE